MSEYIEISEGVVHLMEKSTIKSISLGAFKDALFAKADFRSRLLPSGAIFYGRRDQGHLYIIEEAPAMRTIAFRPDRATDGEVERYSLPMPWVYQALLFHEYALDELRVFFSPSRVEDLSARLCHAPLPNIFRDGKVCLGDLRFTMTTAVPRQIDAIRVFFWDSIFNLDITDLYHAHMPDRIVTAAREIEREAGGGGGHEQHYFAAWAKLDQQAVAALDWHGGNTLDRLIDEMLEP